MRKLKGILVLVLLLALLASPIAVLASDISGAQYYGTIIVSNNSTATTNVAVNCTISTQALIDGGYLNSSANNCVVRSSAGADLPFMPSVNATYPWCVWVPSIGLNSYISDILYTANSTGGKIRYFPTTAGMASSDNANMELGDNFTIEQSGWVDTSYSANKTLIYKEDAFQTYISGAENITSEIGDWVSPTGDVDPDGAWANETNAYDENTATFATEALVPATSWSSYIILTRPAVNCDAVRWWSRSGVPANDKVDVDVYYSGAWQDVYEGVSASEVWVEKGLGGTYSINGTRWRWYNSQGGAADARLHEFDFWETTAVTATGVASGEHIVRTEAGLATGDLLHFDGSANSYMVCVANTYDSLAQFWIYMQLRLDNAHQAGSGTHYLFGKFKDPTHYIYARFTNGGNLQLGIRPDGAGATYVSSAETVWNADQWYEVIFSLSDTEGAALIVNDGTPVTDADARGTPPGIGYLQTGKYGGEPTDGFIGEIATVIVGTDNLTVVERTNLFNGIPPGDETDYWLANEGTGAAITSYGSVGTAGSAGTATTWEVSSRIHWFSIQVDGTLEDETPLEGASVPDNANDWAFYVNMADYWHYTKIWVDEVLQQHIEWEYDTTFTDLSGNSHDATPTFRTTSSDPDVSAVLSSFLPVSEAKAPGYALEEAPPFIETVPTIVSEWDVTPPAGTFPLAGVIAAIASATDTPAQLPLLIIAAFVIIACSLAISATMRRYGSGSLIVKSLVITALMGVFIALGNFGIDFWMLYVFLIIAVALSMASRHTTWQ